MGYNKKFKDVLKSKGVTITEFAKMNGYARQTVANMLCRDAITYSTLEAWLDSLNCDIVFRDRETGKLYK